MKTLFLVRHSKAVTRKANLPDFRRALVKTGEKKSMSMAKKLKKEGVMPDLIISSTANRALETAHLFARHLDYPSNDIVVKDALYNEMSPEALLYLVRQVDNTYKSIMLFGHNPAFTDFASYLVRGFDQDIPKTGIVGIQFRKDSWKEVSKGDGKLEFFEYPKRLAKTMKRLEAELKSEIIKATQNILEHVDAKSTEKIKKQVAKASDKIAKDFIKIMKATASEEEKKALAREKAQAAKPKFKAKPESQKPVVKSAAGRSSKPIKKGSPAKAAKKQTPRSKRAATPKKATPKKPASTKTKQGKP